MGFAEIPREIVAPQVVKGTFFGTFFHARAERKYEKERFRAVRDVCASPTILRLRRETRCCASIIRYTVDLKICVFAALADADGIFVCLSLIGREYKTRRIVGVNSEAFAAVNAYVKIS